MDFKMEILNKWINMKGDDARFEIASFSFVSGDDYHYEKVNVTNIFLIYRSIIMSSVGTGDSFLESKDRCMKDLFNKYPFILEDIGQLTNIEDKCLPAEILQRAKRFGSININVHNCKTKQELETFFDAFNREMEIYNDNDDDNDEDNNDIDCELPSYWKDCDEEIKHTVLDIELARYFYVFNLDSQSDSSDSNNISPLTLPPNDLHIEKKTRSVSI